MSKNPGIEAARTLNRRFRARVLYRRRRDNKVAVDLMGKEFKYNNVRWRIVRYEPETAQLRLAYLEVGGATGTIEMDTDEFWRLRRKGEMVDA